MDRNQPRPPVTPLVRAMEQSCCRMTAFQVMKKTAKVQSVPRFGGTFTGFVNYKAPGDNAKGG